MNETVSVITLDDNIDYVVLEKITFDSHEYLILFEDEKPDHIVIAELLEEEQDSFIETVEDDELTIKILDEFFKRHPEFKK